VRFSLVALLWLGAMLAPVGAGGATDYDTIWAGVDHTCAITPTGSADCWGLDTFGQSTDRPGPYQEVSADGMHNCAVTPDGAAEC